MSLKGLQKEKERDFRKVLRQAGVPFTFERHDYDCIPGPSDEETYQLGADGGGTMETYDLTLTTLASHFDNRPSPRKGKFLEIEGRKLQIESANKIPGSPLLKINCSNLDE